MSKRTGILVGMFTVMIGVMFADILLIIAGAVVLTMESTHD